MDVFLVSMNSVYFVKIIYYVTFKSHLIGIWMAFESNQMHLNQMQVQMQMSMIQMQVQMQMRPPRRSQMQVQMQMPHLHLQVQMHLHLNTSLMSFCPIQYRLWFS